MSKRLTDSEDRPAAIAPFSLGLLVAAAGGCAALSHEFLWTRRLIDLLGASHESTARVLGCFFFGLAIGAAWAARALGKSPQDCPWLSVGKIEIGIALTTFPALMLPKWTSWMWPALGPDRLVSWPGWLTKIGLSILVVVPPAFFMGMTLPFLARAVLGSDRTLSKQGNWLYAANTAGGVLGLLLTVGVSMRLLGVGGAMSWTLALNILIGMMCFSLDRRFRSGVAKSVTAATKADAQQEGSPHHKHSADADQKLASPLYLMMFISFVSGAIVLAFEVLALQSVLNVVPANLYATSTVLGVVIVVLAVAASIVPWVVRERRRPIERLLVWVLAASAVLTASIPFVFVWYTNGLSRLPDAFSLLGFLATTSWCLIVSAGVCLLVSGLVLPVTFAWHSQSSGNTHGDRWGWLLAANGMGGMLGAELANSLLMPSLGIHRSFCVLGAGYALAAVLVAILVTDKVKAIVSVCVLVVCLGLAYLAARLPLMRPSPGWKTIDVSTGSEGVIAVVEQTSKKKSWQRGIVHNNQFQLGSTGGTHSQRRKMILPLLLHPNPRQVLCIGVATGITAGAALDFDVVQHLTAVEISGLTVQAAAEYFQEDNRDVCDNSRANVIVEDGRTFVASCVKKFDVVVADLFRPWAPGVGRLYSVEHFQNAKRSLRHQGMFCQWLPLYQLNRVQFEVILGTFRQVFPTTHLIRGSFRSTVPAIGLLGFREGEIDWPGLASRCELLRASSRVVDPSVRHSPGVLMHYLGFVGNEDVFHTTNTLDNAWIEILAASGRVARGAARDELSRLRWLTFEAEMAARLQLPVVGDWGTEPLEHWRSIGLRICRTHLAAVVHGDQDQRVIDMKNAILEGLPDEMVRDSEADWNSWPILVK